MKRQPEENPAAIDFLTYASLVKHDWQYLLTYKPDNEGAFQQFMEMNPSLVPGSRAEIDFGPSGLGPERQTLITQPDIKGIINRQPDFMWLAFDTRNFTPVLVKIEAPSRKYFNKDGAPTTDFTKAKNQLDEWKMALSRPENILSFYESYDISTDLRKMIFKPLYLLVYGQQSEYEHNSLLKSKRSDLLDKDSNQYLTSFDRIGQEVLDRNFVTSIVKDGKFKAKYLAPTFKLGAFESHILQIDGLVEAVGRMGYSTPERRDFLKKRIPYWINQISGTAGEKKQGGRHELGRPLE